MPCPLCTHPDPVDFASDKRRSYLRCPSCDLIFVPPRFHLSPAEERRRYDLHDNSLFHDGYVAYLQQCVDVVSRRVQAGTRILDYGCGKNAVLVELLRRRGYDATGYDPLYGIGPGSAGPVFDAVVLWEVFEHLRNPREELLRIKRLLRPGGILVLRTQIHDESADFLTWWYTEDPTHIVFAGRRTIEAVGTLLGRIPGTPDGTGIFLFVPPSP